MTSGKTRPKQDLDDHVGAELETSCVYTNVHKHTQTYTCMCTQTYDTTITNAADWYGNVWLAGIQNVV